jgi:crossover junction endodeoxyribonuclease RuvC
MGRLPSVAAPLFIYTITPQHLYTKPVYIRYTFCMSVRIMGIDPGYERCGVAVIEKHTGSEYLVDSTCIRTLKTDSFPTRLLQLGNELEKLVITHAPQFLILENLFFNANVKTALQVAHARGVIQFIAAKHTLSIYEYSPGEIKVALTGHGKADKQQVAFMIDRLLKLPTKKRLDDEYDAIAVALTHSACMR